MTTSTNPDFTIKKGDTGPPLIRTLYGQDGAVQDLTAATVTFNMKKGALVVIDHGTCSIVGAETLGVVQYDWNVVDTETKGTYKAEFEAILGDGTIVSFPDNSDFFVRIYEEVA